MRKDARVEAMSSSRNQALAAGVAFVVLAAAPQLAGDGQGGTTGGADAKGAKGTLTVELEGGQGDDGSPYRLPVDGPGPAPTETAEATLRDASGRHTGEVAPVDDCGNAVARTAFDRGETPWCLELRSIDAGHELTGTVAADGNELALTVRRRDGFWGPPLGVLVGGLLAGLAAATVPPWLRGRVRPLVLERLLDANEAADAAEQVTGLREWAEDRVAEGDDQDAVIEKVDWVVEHGPALARRVRSRLDRELAPMAPEDQHPLVSASRAQAATPTHEVGDFYDEDARVPHPAQQLAEALPRLTAIRAELDGQERALDGIAPSPEKTTAGKRLGATQAKLDGVATPAELEGMGSHLDALKDAMHEARAAAERRRIGPVSAGLEAADSVPWAPRGAVLSGIVTPTTVAGRRGQAIVMTVLVALVALAFASVTLYHAGYHAKPLFHSWGDYLELFSAAAAAGAAGTLLTLIGYWRPGSSADAA